ncbi:MAG TPA: hypothetical protein VFG69_03755 [Nannocystaceae bacterium]|jgi:hypothetical protein|nr:hypothetical protein [Nannocystaceae bacterium]
MVLLLATRDQRVVRCRRSRRDHIYVRGQLLGRVMRHLGDVVTIEIALLSGCVVRPADLALLIPAAGSAHRIAPPELGAVVVAVHVAVVAPPAQEEHLTTAAADDEAEGVHGSGRNRQELDAAPEPCDEAFVEPGSGRTT